MKSRAFTNHRRDFPSGIRVSLFAVLAASLSLAAMWNGRPVHAAAFTSTQSGSWGSAATWGGAGVPGVGDDVTIATGTTVTQDVNRTVSNLTINAGGTLNGGNAGTFFHVSGTNIVNNGSLAVFTFSFTGSGTQTLSGAGTFTSTSMDLFNGSVTTLGSDVAISVGNFVVNGGGTLSLSSNSLTFNGGSFTKSNSAIVTGTGTFRTQGTPTLTSVAGSTFSAPLEINSGTTTLNTSAIAGSISILSGATLLVGNSQLVTASGDTTINSGGTLSGVNASSIFAASCANIVNNGSVTVASLRFTCNGPQSLSGTGSFSSNTVSIFSGSTTTLSSNHQLSTVVINGGGTFDISNRTLSLSGAGTPLTILNTGTLITTGSTIVYNGVAAQTAAGIPYNNLTIGTSAGVTLNGNATVNGILDLAGGDLNTSTFTLTQPNTTASTGTFDVVGAVQRTGAPLASGVALTFGNPDNRITFTAAVTQPTQVTMTMQKAAPATYTAAVQRNYNITQTGGVGFSSTLRLHYLDSELNGNSETPAVDFNLRKGPNWNAVVPTSRNTGGTADNWLENNAVTSFSQWTFANLAPTAASGVVTGRIVDQSGNPVAGAVVRLSGTQTRKFITDANGFYRFDDVETNGFYTVTPARVNYTFSPSLRSFSQIGETTEAAFGATATGQNANPLDTPEYFVRQHYLDFLGREPDEAGFNFWSDQILECNTDTNCVERRRENVSAAYFLSIEFQQTGGLVAGLYRASYGVRPQFAELMPDARAVARGVIVGKQGWQALLAANTEAFVNAFVNRPAFHAAYDGMDNSLFVDALISHTGVSFTSSDRDALISGLIAGTMTRAEALRSIAENPRFVSAKFNEAFVLMEYFGYLRRDPDDSGYHFWLNKLNEFGGNFEQAEMVKAFIVSGEYRNRFPR